MKAVMVMFDSLNRHMLPAYGCEWTHAPNFERLAKKTVTFDRSYVCSMPCMPARRDLHTGRPNFLHRSWGPIEPFDDSMPQILRENGIYSHLCSDHYHYWEDGGATYHNRYSSWEFFRGQEGDPWKGQVADPNIPQSVSARHNSRNWRQDWVNRNFMREEKDQPQPQTFSAGLDFLRRNHAQDKFFLQIETFDPHEPFFSHRKYKDLYPHEYTGCHFDWPPYAHVKESREELQHCRYEYAALLSMCDAYLGDVLDAFDQLDLWKDTMLIVWTDHGFMLGEHDMWAKVWMPFYQEIANTPFFVWDPRIGKCDERRSALVQPAIDLAPTLLEFFGIEPTKDMRGHPLACAFANDTPVRESAIFGIHGRHINITDGRYVYMRGSATQSNRPLSQYTLMPTHMNHMFTPQELSQLELADPFSFTKGCRTLKIDAATQAHGQAVGFLTDTMLWDVQTDPHQKNPLTDPAVEKRMIKQMVKLMRECDSPMEQFARLGLTNETMNAEC
jgi:arylsulfatase A-like enzyme